MDWTIKMKILMAFLPLILPAAALAGSNVSTKIDAFVEKVQPAENGTNKLVLQEAKLVVPGDKLVYVLSYHNGGASPASNVIINDPLPSHVVFDGSPDSSALVSVDGGKSWGILASLKVNSANGVRAARPDDVTNVRWVLKSALPAGSEGKLSFRATVK